MSQTISETSKGHAPSMIYVRVVRKNADDGRVWAPAFLLMQADQFRSAEEFNRLSPDSEIPFVSVDVVPHDLSSALKLNDFEKSVAFQTFNRVVELTKLAVNVMRWVLERIEMMSALSPAPISAAKGAKQ